MSVPRSPFVPRRYPGTGQNRRSPFPSPYRGERVGERWAVHPHLCRAFPNFHPATSTSWPETGQGSETRSCASAAHRAGRAAPRQHRLPAIRPPALATSRRDGLLPFTSNTSRNQISVEDSTWHKPTNHREPLRTVRCRPAVVVTSTRFPGPHTAHTHVRGVERASVTASIGAHVGLC